MKSINTDLYYKAVKADEELSEALAAQFGASVAGTRRYDADKSKWNKDCVAAYHNKVSADTAWRLEMDKAR